MNPMKPLLSADFESLMGRLMGSKPLTPEQIEIFRFVWLSGALGFIKSVGEATAAARTATTSPAQEFLHLSAAFLKNSEAVRDLFIEHNSTLQVRALMTRAKAG